MNTFLEIIYDFGARGPRVLSFSTPVILCVSAVAIVSAIAWPFISPPAATTWLEAAFTLLTGLWMGLLGLHYVRDRQAFRTRYVLTASGVEIAALGGEPQCVTWPQITLAYRSRLLRYFRLEGPVTPAIVLMFGAPPPTERTGQTKYRHTGQFIHEKLRHRMVRRWL